MKRINTIKDGEDKKQILDEFCKNNFDLLIEGVENAFKRKSKYQYTYNDEYIKVENHDNTIMTITKNGISFDNLCEKTEIEAKKIIQELINFAEDRIINIEVIIKYFKNIITFLPTVIFMCFCIVLLILCIDNNINISLYLVFCLFTFLSIGFCIDTYFRIKQKEIYNAIKMKNRELRKEHGKNIHFVEDGYYINHIEPLANSTIIN